MAEGAEIAGVVDKDIDGIVLKRRQRIRDVVAFGHIDLDERAPANSTGSMSQIQTSAPLSTSEVAMARPMPRAPPVTTAV